MAKVQSQKTIKGHNLILGAFFLPLMWSRWYIKWNPAVAYSTDGLRGTKLRLPCVRTYITVEQWCWYWTWTWSSTQSTQQTEIVFKTFIGKCKLGTFLFYPNNSLSKPPTQAKRLLDKCTLVSSMGHEHTIISAMNMYSCVGGVSNPCRTIIYPSSQWYSPSHENC